jgi:metal-responsive CopG/Arc/MetJ family transcriptional regulator
MTKAGVRTVPPKCFIQYRIGEDLLIEADQLARKLGYEKRTTFIIDVVTKAIERGYMIPYPTLASIVTGHRIVVTMRMPEMILELINEQCFDQGISRTTWILDAILSVLAEHATGVG